jgi:hypothetical protein
VSLHKFVFTGGGPCAEEKLTALAHVFLVLRECGFECNICPDASTIVATNGMNMYRRFRCRQALVVASGCYFRPYHYQATLALPSTGRHRPIQVDMIVMMHTVDVAVDFLPNTYSQ